MSDILDRGKSFVKDIEDIVWAKDVSFMEAVLIYCETHNIEPESVATYIKKVGSLKEQIFKEASKLNLVVKVK
jgi:hypothetical protein